MLISEKIVKDKFIVDTLRNKFDEIRAVQLKILSLADDKIRKKFNIPNIEEKVSNRLPFITGSSGQIMLSLLITKRFRFLDMKKLGNLKIYNKQVWGTVYNDIAPELKYGFSEEIKDSIRNELKQAIE
jgi:hypothetical protein